MHNIINSIITMYGDAEVTSAGHGCHGNSVATFGLSGNFKSMMKFEVRRCSGCGLRSLCIPIEGILFCHHTQITKI